MIRMWMLCFLDALRMQSSECAPLGMTSLGMLLKVSFLLVSDLRKLSHHLLTMTWPLRSLLPDVTNDLMPTVYKEQLSYKLARWSPDSPYICAGQSDYCLHEAAETCPEPWPSTNFHSLFQLWVSCYVCSWFSWLVNNISPVIYFTREEPFF